MTRYLKYFAAVYSLALLLFISILIFGFKLSGLTILPTLIISALISARQFVKQKQRLPSAEEKIQLVWGSSAVAIIIASFFIFFLVFINPKAEEILKLADQTGLGLYAIIMLCLVAIHGAIFSFAYGWYTRYCLHKASLSS